MLIDAQTLKQAWIAADSQYDFAQACYREGLKDGKRQATAQSADPVLNGVLHVLDYFSNKGSQNERNG